MRKPTKRIQTLLRSAGFNYHDGNDAWARLADGAEITNDWILQFTKEWPKLVDPMLMLYERGAFSVQLTWGFHTNGKYRVWLEPQAAPEPEEDGVGS